MTHKPYNKYVKEKKKKRKENRKLQDFNVIVSVINLFMYSLK